MPEHLRALVVILLLAAFVFHFVGKNNAIIQAQKNFSQRKKLWFVLTIAAFLAHSFWLYALIAIIALFVTQKREPTPTALFYFLVFLLPAASIQIPGFGMINYLKDIDHVQLLILVILLPAKFKLSSHPNTLPFGKLLPDKLLVAFIMLTVVLGFTRFSSFTGSVREFINLLINVYLPYYVFSRGIRDIEELKDTLSSYVIAAAVVAVVAGFEFMRHWMLYSAVVESLGLNWGGMGLYLPREGLLRAVATTGQPIALGLTMVVAIAFCNVLIMGKIKKNVILSSMLTTGVIAPLSRGPWVGLAVLAITFVGSGKKAVPNLAKFLIAALVFFALLAVLPGGQRILSFLPFVGTVEKGGIEYRNQLIDNSMITIARNPLFGTSNYLEYPEMQEMVQGQGIVDITNTFLAIALDYGLVGLLLFCSFFLAIIFRLYKCIKLVQGDEELYWLGRTLLAVVLAMLVILVTVSSISIIPLIYWTVSGICVAYFTIVNSQPGKLTNLQNSHNTFRS